MNIILSKSCRKSCRFCFAMESLDCEPDEDMFMTMSDYQYALEWLAKQGERCIKLLGGEPLLHPDIGNVLETSIQDSRFERITIFTGGIYPSELNGYLSMRRSLSRLI